MDGHGEPMAQGRASLGKGALADYEPQQADRKDKMLAEPYDKNRAAAPAKEIWFRDSDKLGPDACVAALPADGADHARPAEAWTRSRYAFDPTVGRVVSIPA